MAEEEVAAPAAPSSPALLADHKRKHDELEEQLPVEAPRSEDEKKSGDVAEEEPEELDSSAIDADLQEAKRARVDDKTLDEPVGQNGFGEGKSDEDAKEHVDEQNGKSELPEESDPQPAPEGAQPASDGAMETAEHNDEKVVGEEADAIDDKKSAENKLESAEVVELGKAEELSKQEDQQLEQDVEEIVYDGQTTSRKTEVPNDKVGVLIGKGGDTIRFLQQNSGAKIQIMRDAEADPRCTTRPVEIIGTLASISKAEKLIHAVIAEASVGGSPSLVARGHPSAQSTGAPDQIEMQVPNEKVGLIIGKGGETIKGLQTKTGARIQLIPQHLPEGDGSKERTVRVTGDRAQIEMARELIKEVMSQNVRQSSNSGGYNQQQPYRSRGPNDRGHYGPRGPHPAQPTPYDYHQRGPYPPHGMHYPPPSYGNYPPQHMGPRSNYGSGWEQRPPPPSSGGYDYYGGQRGHMPDHPASAPVSGPHPHGPAPQTNYGYGQPQPHGSDYGNQAPYSQPVPQQSYDNHAPVHNHYGHASAQPGYPPAASQPGYAPHQQYNKQPSYGMQPAPGQQPPQQYSASQPYGQGAPTQQQYPYPSTAPVQQGYPPAYGAAATATAADGGYNQAAPPASAYGQTAGQQPAQQGYPQQAGYAQGTTAASYGSYPSSQGYPDQAASNAAGYGYQAQDPAYGSTYGAQPAAGSTYGAQPAAGSTYGVQPAAGSTYGAQPAAGTTYGAQPAAGSTYGAQPAAGTTYGAQPAAGSTYGAQPAAGSTYGAQPAAGSTYGTQPAATSTYGAQPAAGQQVYAQPTVTAAPTQPSYDQSVPQSAPGSTPSQPAAAYPQYDSTQMHAAAPH